MLEGQETAALRHDRLEELIEAQGRQLLRQLLQDHLDLQALREEAELTAHLARGERPAGRRLERGHTRLLATVVGTVRVRRCALRSAGRANLYPADVRLSLPAGRHSFGVRRLAVPWGGALLLRHHAGGDLASGWTGGGQAAGRSPGAKRRDGHRRLLPLPYPGPVHSGHVAGDLGGRQGCGDASRSTAGGHPQSRRPCPGDLPHPAGLWGEAQPQAHGHPSGRLRRGPGCASSPRCDRRPRWPVRPPTGPAWGRRRRPRG